MHFTRSLEIFFLLIFTVGFSNAYSQNLINSRKTSYYTYIYKLTNQEARKIYRKDLSKVDRSYFHTLVDSFITDSTYTGVLPEGHYLKTYALKNKLQFSITTVQNFDVFILNNNTDLCIQVCDLQGNIITDADVEIHLKKLHFDIRTKSYIDRKSNKKGFLKVKYNGFTAYYNLARQYNNPLIKQGAQKAIYSTPLKYAWLPVRYVIHLPIDGVKSISKEWPQGTIYNTKNFFVRTYHKIASIFDDYHRDYGSHYYYSRNSIGYMVFNKPKYHPGDTVKFKAFLVNKKARPIHKTVDVFLQTRNKNLKLAELKPYREGGYAGQFFLHDSLQLQLDRSYPVLLESKKGKSLQTGFFYFEDYELSKNKLSLRLDHEKQYRNDSLHLFVKGTDENDLNLLDARIEVLAKTKSVDRFFGKSVFVPDTLFFLETKLKPVGDTEVDIADTNFPKANLDYTITLRLLASDNEAISENRDVHYMYDSKEFDLKLLTDSIRVQYTRNGKSLPRKAKITVNDNFGNKTTIFEGTIPYTIKLDPFYASYTVSSDSLSNTMNLSSQSSLFQCFSERTSDSVFIVADNPRKIPFVYTVYKRNNQKASGYADSLNYKRKTDSKQNYFISIRYVWGGQVKEENYQIPLNDKKLNISVSEPRIVYPGQKSHIEIRVTDMKGKPVEGVDLTAYSLTKKFGYKAPEISYLGKIRKNKNLVNNFHFEQFKTTKMATLNLDYNAWNLLARLDSIEYYKFIYPGKNLYRYEYQPNDSITQFAPFVVSKGDVLPIHVVEVDNKPVYFSWSTNIRPYSFRIDSGYHQIRLRTSVKSITIDSLYFSNKKKLIFSLDADENLKNVTIQEREKELSASEQRLLYNYVFPYRNTFGERYAFLEQKDEIQFLKPAFDTRNSFNFAGPVSGYLSFHEIDGFSSEFKFEPYFEYDFAPGLLKMRSLDSKSYPKYLNVYHPYQGLSETILTEKSLQEQWKSYLDAKRYRTARYKYPNSTSPGNGKLQVNVVRKDHSVKDTPLNMLVFRYDNPEFLRVYPGNVSLVHDLSKGYYKLIFFYTGSKYQVRDSLFVESNGLNYYEFIQPDVFKKDSFSISVNKLIEKTIFKPSPYYNDEEKELKLIYNSYQQQFQYTGEGIDVEGYVRDIETGEPLPGVSVVIRGTTYGTITGLDGHYSLKVPNNVHVLDFSFVGYEPSEEEIGDLNVINANLSASKVAMDEVVVIGYGQQRTVALAGAVAGVSVSSAILKTIPGVSGNISQSLNGITGGVSIEPDNAGTGVSIRIRGSSSISLNQTPLYIINGNVFAGNIADLDPNLIQNIQVLQGADATALYGSRGANGVVVINTNPGTFKPALQLTDKGADFDNAFLDAASKSSSIRKNFSDYAFWEPKLTTDQNGKTGFDVTFPDDVTSWETFYLAMNGHRQSGQTANRIKSYKPLMAQLAVPRFLVQSDTTFVVGKTLNYLPDSVRVTTRFEINGQLKLDQTKYCTNSILDTIPVTASSDSVSVKYSLKKVDGYFDGELRHIPVYPLGLEETRGDFHVLDKDTTIELSFDPNLGEAQIYARADILDLIQDEINHVIKYKYLCNEQLASKLKVLLAERSIAVYTQKEFKSDKDVVKLIRLLNKNQKSNGLWGWWKDSDENSWISLHVLEALIQAGKQGYAVKIDKENLTGALVWELQGSRDLDQKIKILRILKLLDAHVDYPAYISDLERNGKFSLNDLLQITELRQQCNLAYNPDTLKHYQKRTLFGNIYFEDDNDETNLLVNDIQNTLMAYRILKADSTKNSRTLSKIRNYLLENRKSGYWQNTYESAQIIGTILPDLLHGHSAPAKPSLKIQGDVFQTVSKFPFEIKVDPTQNIRVSKTGDFPVYLTNYQLYWNNTPKVSKGDFEITTRFDHDSLTVLKAGKEITLIADVAVKKDVQYVMINIPIPGGCSYADKKNNFRNESHREYFKNETTIFCESLKKGNYSFEVKLIPRFTGTYSLNPAKVELMYFPKFKGNNDIKRVKISGRLL